MKARKNTLTGLHILGEIYTSQIQKLRLSRSFNKFLIQAIKKYRLTILGECLNTFPNEGGFSLVVNLIESHIAVHTWPELGLLTLDVYICNFLKNNDRTCRAIFNLLANYFGPDKIHKKVIRR